MVVKKCEANKLKKSCIFAFADSENFCPQLSEKAHFRSIPTIVNLDTSQTGNGNIGKMNAPVGLYSYHMIHPAVEQFTEPYFIPEGVETLQLKIG